MESQNQIVPFIIVGTFVLLFLVLVIILFVMRYQRKMYLNKALLSGIENTKQLELFEASSLAEEKEKERISRNIHDEVKPMLILLSQQLEKKGVQLQKNNINANFDSEFSLIDKLFDSLRNISYELVPTFIYEHGLIKSLITYTNDLNELGNINLKVHLQNTPIREEEFTHHQLLTIYRVCLEILNNTIKHSGCHNATVGIATHDNKLTITFSHDGVGISNEDFIEQLNKSQTLGLKSIQARALLLNSTLDFKKLPDSAEIMFATPIPQYNIHQA